MNIYIKRCLHYDNVSLVFVLLIAIAIAIVVIVVGIVNIIIIMFTFICDYSVAALRFHFCLLLSVLPSDLQFLGCEYILIAL